MMCWLQSKAMRSVCRIETLPALLLAMVLSGCGRTEVSTLDATVPGANDPPPSGTVTTQAYVHFGDSITCGNGSTDHAHSYAGLMDATVPGDSLNDCSQGALSVDLSPIVYKSLASVVPGDTSTIMVGTNDVVVCRPLDGCLADYAKTLTGMAALLAMPRADQVPALAMTRTGQWGIDREIPGDVGLRSSLRGSTATFTVQQTVAGRHLFVAWKATDDSSGAATIRVDGGVVGETVVRGEAKLQTPHDTRSAVFASAFPLGAAGPHTVEIENTGSGSFTLEWAGVNTQNCIEQGTPHLILGTVPKQFMRYDDMTEAYSVAVAATAGLLVGDGMFVEVADTHDGIGPYQFVDFVHPNNDGHAGLAAAFLHPVLATP